MNRTTKRLAVWLIALVFVLSLVKMPEAKAANPGITVDITDFTNDSMVMTTSVSNPILSEDNNQVIFNIMIKNSTGKAITVSAIKPKYSAVFSSQVSVIDFDKGLSLASNIGINTKNGFINDGDSKEFICYFATNTSADIKTYPEQEIQIYLEGSGNRYASMNVRVNKESAPIAAPVTPEPSAPPLEKAVIVLDQTDLQGRSVPAPSGNNGDPVSVILPVRNRGAYITDVEIRPEISGDLNSFPFVLDSVNYVQRIPSMNKEQKVMLRYDFKLNPKVTRGIKVVKFLVNYTQSGEQLDTFFNVFVNVVKGAPETTGTQPVTNQSKAKIIISGYKFTPEVVYAGEEFVLDVTLNNTSEKEDVKNIKVSFANEAGVIIPASSGSNTFYVSKIPKMESYTESMKLQVGPDADAKPYMFIVDIEYDGAAGATIETKETIAIPVNQHMRVKIDDPLVMGDAMIGQPLPVSCAIYNLGKTPLYNLMVSIEGEGVKTEEDFFGGNVSSGSVSRADLNAICDNPGSIEAKMVITFEDKFGVQTREERPVSLFVNEMPSEPSFNEGEMPPEKQQSNKKFPIGYAGIGGGVLAGIGALTVVLKKRKAKKAMEEDI